MWFIIDLVLGIGLTALVLSLRNRDINFKWYEAAIGVVGLLLLMFTIANFFGSFAEVEAAAASLYLLVMGLPALILLAVTWLLVRRRQSAAG